MTVVVQDYARRIMDEHEEWRWATSGGFSIVGPRLMPPPMPPPIFTKMTIGEIYGPEVFKDWSERWEPREMLFDDLYPRV